MNTTTNRVTGSAFLQALFAIALPVAFQNLLNTTASMVDTIMIGSQGELAVAAVGICSQISSLFFSAYFGFAGGALLFFSQYWGEKNEKGINKTFGASFIFMLLVALVFCGMAVINPEFLLRIYTDKEDIVATAIPYIRIVGFSYPVLVINVLLSFMMRSTERVKAPLYCSILALIVNFVLNWILIYGRFGFPAMGPAGAAIGTLASTIVNFIGLVLCVLLGKSKVKLHLRMMFHWEDRFLRMYLLKCFPIICNEFLYGIGQMLINIVIGRQSSSVIAAMAAFRVLEGFVFAFFGGLADASCVVVGKEVGAGKHMNAYQYTKGFSVLVPAITFVICLVGVAFNQPLLGLFGLGAEALNYGKYMLLIYLAAGTIRTCNFIMNVCFRSAGEPVFGSVVEISCLFLISVPATWMAGMVWNLPFLAVFAFIYTDEILRFIVEIRYFKRAKWIKPVTDAGKATIEEFHREMEALRHKKQNA